MIRVLFMLILGLFGFVYDDPKPVRLGKEDNINPNIMVKIEGWCIRHSSFCLLVLFVVLSFLFALALFFMCGVSATESGNVYNHFWDVI